MQDEERKIAWRERYVRYPKLSYSQVQRGLMRILVTMDVGKNGWPVMVALCSQVYADGTLGPMSSERISDWTGLTSKQVARGMAELREKRVIEPVMRKTHDGRRCRDRSNFRHVAQYRFTDAAWSLIEKEQSED